MKFTFISIFTLKNMPFPSFSLQMPFISYTKIEFNKESKYAYQP